MSSTHRLQVLEANGKTVRLRVEIVHDDEHAIPLFRTALASMLLDSLSAAEDAGHRVSKAARDTFSDEFEDDEEAAALVKTVRLVATESGKVRVQNPTQGVRFAKAKGALVVELTTPRASLFAHLVPGLSWETAPVFPEMEEDWPTNDED
ncbi:MAG: hypothetical protein IPJ34_30580 [Myxococcales bacterium]|nr:hypothetical protein [Myxococcales bacterium]